MQNGSRVLVLHLEIVCSGERGTAPDGRVSICYIQLCGYTRKDQLLCGGKVGPRISVSPFGTFYFGFDPDVFSPIEPD